jgi:hypothetical protein
VDISGATTGPAFPAIHNGNFASLLSHSLSTAGGRPSYAIDGMFYITDTSGTGSGYKYFVIEDGTDVQLFSALLNADDSDKDWNLAHHENWVIESVTTIPSTLHEGRMVLVDSGTNDDGKLYICDQSAYRRVLTNAVLFSTTDPSRYYRHHVLAADASGIILNLVASSSVTWTTVDVGSLVSGMSHLTFDVESMVLINVAISDTSGRATVSFRRNGMTIDTGKKTCATVAAETGVAQYAQFWVSTSLGVIEYQLVSAAASSATVQVTVESAISFS